MLEEASQSLKAYLYDRTQSPLFGAFIASWILWNHRLLLVLFSDKIFEEKFEYIDKQLYPQFTLFSFPLSSMFDPKFHVYPLVTAILTLLLYPHPAKWIFKYWKQAQITLKHERQQLEEEELLSKEEAQKIRTSVREERAKYKDEIEDKSLEISDKDKQISDQKKEIASLKENLKLNTSISLTEEEMRNWLTSDSFLLIFNPNKPNGSKEIMFLVGGEIGAGKNQNENKWRITSAGQLEILKDDGSIHSTFLPIFSHRILISNKNSITAEKQILIQNG